MHVCPGDEMCMEGTNIDIYRSVTTYNVYSQPTELPVVYVLNRACSEVKRIL